MAEKRDWNTYLSKQEQKKWGFVKHHRKNEVIAYFTETEAKYSFYEDGQVESKIRTISKDSFLKVYELATPDMYCY